jgi:hypothetical protein
VPTACDEKKACPDVGNPVGGLVTGRCDAGSGMTSLTVSMSNSNFYKNYI